MSYLIALNELCTKITDGAHHSPKAFEGGKPMFSVKDMVDQGFDYSGTKTISEEDYIKLIKAGCQPEEGDILIAKDGSVLKHIFEVRGEIDYVLLSSIAILRPKREMVLPRYLVYALKDPLKEKDIRSNYVSGSGVPRIVLKDFGKVRINLPPLTEQKAIAHILGTLDDKIELNRQMNQTLETMAQTLFKSWFVDFDPVIDNLPAGQAGALPDTLKTKYDKRQLVSDNKKLIHTNPELAALFPSNFEYSEALGKWIPEGWEDTDMTQCLDTISKTYNLKEIDEIIFLNTGDIEEGRFLHNHYSNTQGLPGQAKKSIQEGDILYSEIRPKNKRFAYVYFDASDYVVSTKLMVLRPKNEIDPLFYYQILKSESTLAELQFLAESRSGTFPQITYDTLKAIRFVLPKHKGILDHFTKVLKINFERSIENQKQTEVLTQLRDTLLPQLISGKVRVPAEVIAKAVMPESQLESTNH